ncbi:MAG: tRNA (N6-isopentenyl adenosine(37)-C2)-methylthiotransferase MiaB [Lachnospiraceae bacterium]
MYNEINWDSIDLKQAPPDIEPQRQYYFIKMLKNWFDGKVKEKGRKLTCQVNTFGCQMNSRDSEKILGILKCIGYIQSDSENADLVVFNTCTVRENANLKVYGRIGQLKKYKVKNPGMVTVLCGCMMQEKEAVAKIRKSYKNVDIIFGTHNIYKFAELLAMKVLDSPDSSKMIIDILDNAESIVENLPSKRKYPFKSGVNIMYGCNNFCSYCIVPYVRGRERSRKPEDIIKEIEELVKDGVKEVMLLGQNVNSYGKNLENPVTFTELLEMVEHIDGLCRIRFMTSHPKDLSDSLIEFMGRSKKLCKHIHLPLQSGSSRLLKIMNRHYTKEDYLLLVDKIKKAVPDIAVTTDIITGFPGETEEDFNETLDVIEKAGFDNAFTFIYSKRTGTPAASMEGQVPENVVKERFDRLLEKVHNVSSKKSAQYLGKVYDVLAEEVNVQEDGYITGRMGQNYLVHFKGDKNLIGKIVPVKLCESRGFYYYGELVQNNK